MTTTYGVIVENVTKGETFHTLQGETPDPNAGLWVTDPLTATVGFDPMNYPGPLVPAVAGVTLFARTPADLPAWTPGDIIRVSVVVPPATPGPTWWEDTHPAWMRLRLRLAVMTAAARPGGLSVSLTLTDLMSFYAGRTLTVTRAAETFAARFDALTTAAGISPFGFGPDGLGSTGDAGPIVYDGVSWGEAVETLMAGSITGADPPRRVTYSSRFADFVMEAHPVGRTTVGPITTPYQLTTAGTAQARSPLPAGNSGTTARSVIVPACAVPLDGISWEHAPGTNTVVLDTIAADGTPAVAIATHPQLLSRGAITRTIPTQALATDAADVARAAKFYLGDETTAAPQWRPSTIVVQTRHLDPGRLAEYAPTFDPYNGDNGPLQAQVVVVDVDDTWGLTPSGGDGLAGTIARQTFSIAAGRLDIALDIVPELLEPVGDSATSAASYADLGTATPALQYQQIDPTLSYLDMRLIGV